MAKKNFFEGISNPAEMFIETTAPKGAEQTEPAKNPAPQRTQFNRDTETRSRRLQLLIKPSTAEKLKARADKEKRSVNDFINLTLEEILKGE